MNQAIVKPRKIRKNNNITYLVFKDFTSRIFFWNKVVNYNLIQWWISVYYFTNSNQTRNFFDYPESDPNPKIFLKPNPNPTFGNPTQHYCFGVCTYLDENMPFDKDCEWDINKSLVKLAPIFSKMKYIMTSNDKYSFCLSEFIQNCSNFVQFSTSPFCISGNSLSNS